MIKLAIFDMDGTICDTIDDLADATNYALKTLGHPTHIIEKYKYFVGDGLNKLIYRALPDDKKSDADVLEAREIMQSYYRLHFLDKTTPYEGIIELLGELKALGIHLAVCTNKIHPMALEVEKKLFPDMFEMVVGQSEDRPLKPDPYSPLGIMEKFNATPDDTVFIGDSGVDMQTAVNAGVTGIGVTWGFRTSDELKENGARYIADTPIEILNIIKSL